MPILKAEVNLQKGKVKLLVEKNNKKYNIVIPSTYFPLSNKRTINVFNCSNTVLIEEEKVIQLINETEREIGFCYSNSERLYNLLKQNGYSVKYYSGWLFVDEVPVHHAWVLLDGNKLIDLSFGVKDIIGMHNLDRSKPDWRAKFVEMSLELDKLSNAERFIIGKVPDLLPINYVGSESTAEESKLLFNEATKHKESPVHALKDGGMNLNGASEIQKLYYQKKYNNK